MDGTYTSWLLGGSREVRRYEGKVDRVDRVGWVGWSQVTLANLPAPTNQAVISEHAHPQDVGIALEISKSLASSARAFSASFSATTFHYSAEYVKIVWLSSARPKQHHDDRGQLLTSQTAK